MIGIEVDGSLLFVFAPPWQAINWEQSPDRRVEAGRRTVDLAATGTFALLLEAKDDRLKDHRAKRERARAVKAGTFLVEIADKFRHSGEDIREIAAGGGAEPFYLAFAENWAMERRRLVLWWELPPEPPSGTGTEIQRWKAYLSAQTNVLKQRLRDLTPRVLIANRRFGADAVAGLTVQDVASGVSTRRDSIRNMGAATRRTRRGEGP